MPIGSDLRFAIRGLAKSPGFTAVAMLTLALGIGANTAIFSVVNGVLLKPLPLPEADRLVIINNSYPAINLPQASTSPPDFVDYRKETALFQGVFSVNSANLNYSGPGGAERWNGGLATATMFETLRIRPIAGRFYTEDEDQPGKDHVAVLDEGLWRRNFGADPKVVGQTVRLNEKPYEVIGVAPSALGFLSQIDVWVPAAFTPEQLSPRFRGNQSFTSMARLAPGLSIGQATQGLAALTERIRRENPDSYPKGRDWFLIMTPLTELLTGQLSRPLFTLLAAVGFVLLIACTNVANLLLARGAARSKEMSIRTALGASRRTLISQLLVESGVLGVLSGIAGITAGYAFLRGLIALAPANFPRIRDVSIDAPVLLFALALSIVTSLLFGLLPAIQAGRVNLNNALKDATRSGGASLSRGRVRAALVVGEVALSTLLLVGAGLLVRSFLELQKVNAGFSQQNLLSFRVSPPNSDRYDSIEKLDGFTGRALERLRSLPGVQSAGVVSSMPFSGQNSSGSFFIEGRPTGPGTQVPHSDWRIVDAGYFRTMGIPLLRGRAFTTEDRPGSDMVAVVDEKLASQYWPNEDPIGKRLRPTGADTPWARVVGVVGHIKHSKLDTDSKGARYGLIGHYRIRVLNFMVRTSGDPSLIVSGIRGELANLDSNLPMFDVKLMSDRVLDTLLPQRLAAWLLGTLALVALALAAVGIYGVLSQTVLQRTAEIGIRMALGAQRGQVLSLVLRQGLLLSSVGLLIGAVVALGISRFVEKLLFGVKPTDAFTYFAVIVLLTTVAAAACLLPALRASRVDPLVALRYE